MVNEIDYPPLTEEEQSYPLTGSIHIKCAHCQKELTICKMCKGSGLVSDVYYPEEILNLIDETPKSEVASIYGLMTYRPCFVCKGLGSLALNNPNPMMKELKTAVKKYKKQGLLGKSKKGE